MQNPILTRAPDIFHFLVSLMSQNGIEISIACSGVEFSFLYISSKELIIQDVRLILGKQFNDFYMLNILPIAFSQQVKEQFNNKLEYVVSILGFSAGYGSIWRFPYLIFQNGGGVFLIPYLIFIFIIGIPGFYFETALGQLFQKGPPDCFSLEYFYNEVLQISSEVGESGNIVYPLLIRIKISGKIAIFTAIGPFIFLFLFLVRGLMLDGAFIGLKYLLKPDFSKLFTLQIWIDAANQAIWQIGLGCAVLIYFGSYRNRKDELKNTSFLVPLLTVLCGFLSAFTIFTYMGYMSKISGIPIEEIPLAGPDLVFVVFPSVFTLMSFSNILSIFFLQSWFYQESILNLQVWIVQQALLRMSFLTENKRFFYFVQKQI
ncbi:sodium:neurotransmitter symporter family protein, putative [Ichthyophthirius multifiliis]|uniref:Transporter n=1 Tax=Ichthyophthirius multifiliis TaxID=5932 RepID=G0QYI7_ICHMU|nr:sodium:neurotransmitter symporter family protein, putative [Ichthyophthirius multifiliis]EGR29712.1 sodium:neurotransmitter symporter family protein, putative [Ichthyophthirius multifiliis]|eukprot:XP_004030948.1 sodium:neurotransmitter symporter family protein, putative [Ichthyophthirius multifiliis]